MERSSLLRWVLIAAALFLFIRYGWPAITGKNADAEKQPLNLAESNQPTERAEEKLCRIDGQRFTAELSTHGASLRHVWMNDHKYQSIVKGEPTGEQIDLVSTTREDVAPLRTNF